MLRDSYTRYPRPILWLVPGGRVETEGVSVEVEPLYIGKFPVTNEQLEAFDATFERSPISPGDQDPAAGVSFETAAAYCEWYAGVSRKPMRLPTEVEWQYACRGGDAGACSGAAPPDDALWHRGNSAGRLQRLDAKKANGFGLYGMLGGVWEWTSRGTLRGGSLLLDREDISCSVRRAGEETGAADDVGFRIARSFRIR